MKRMNISNYLPGLLPSTLLVRLPLVADRTQETVNGQRQLACDTSLAPPTKQGMHRLENTCHVDVQVLLDGVIASCERLSGTTTHLCQTNRKSQAACYSSIQHHTSANLQPPLFPSISSLEEFPSCLPQSQTLPIEVRTLTAQHGLDSFRKQR